MGITNCNNYNYNNNNNNNFDEGKADCWQYIAHLLHFLCASIAKVPKNLYKSYAIYWNCAFTY